METGGTSGTTEDSTTSGSTGGSEASASATAQTTGSVTSVGSVSSGEPSTEAGPTGATDPVDPTEPTASGTGPSVDCFPLVFDQLTRRCVRRVFLTLDPRTPLLTLEAIDDICEAEAEGLGESDWMAYLSEGNDAPWVRTRINPEQPFQYEDVHGELLSPEGAAFVIMGGGVTPGLVNPLVKDARDANVVTSGTPGSACGDRRFLAWTGLSNPGAGVFSDCAGWSPGGENAMGGLGEIGEADSRWASSDLCACDIGIAMPAEARFICVEMPPPPP